MYFLAQMMLFVIFYCKFKKFLCKQFKEQFKKSQLALFPIWNVAIEARDN
jgi:hypothetical protein